MVKSDETAEPLRIRPLHGAEYLWLAEQGMFGDERIELLGGQMVTREDPPRIRPLHAREYLRLVNEGMLEDEPVELLRGAMVYISPHGDLHDWMIEQLAALFHGQLRPDEARIRIQSVLSLADDVPEPDIAICPPDQSKKHPTTALLVVEVSVSTVAHDLRTKGPIYALGGGLHVVPPPVAEYWVVDGKRGVVHVHTEPVLGAWTQVTVAGRGEVLVPHLLPHVSIPVADILP